MEFDSNGRGNAVPSPVFLWEETHGSETVGFMGQIMRFAVLRHDHPFLHWDLLLETTHGCWTWRLLDAPNTMGAIRAERIADHRPFYLDYEGPVSGDRGVVQQCDAGTFVWITATDCQVAGLISGRQWHGRILLSADAAGSWYLRYLPQEKSASEPV